MASTARPPFILPLVGPRAAAPPLAAAALAWALEVDRGAVVEGLEAVRSVAGHLEAVVEGQDFDVRINAATTPDGPGRGPGRRAGRGGRRCIAS